MTRLKLLQIQGTHLKPIIEITHEIRSAVNEACFGIDDMHMLGSKTLVLRAEIYQHKLSCLYQTLTEIGIKLNEQGLPPLDSLQDEIEYPLSIQITSLCDDTGHRSNLPQIPW